MRTTSCAMDAHNFYEGNHPPKPVITEPELSYRSLHTLCKGEILAIRVPDYCGKAACKQILARLETANQYAEKYDNAPELDIYRLGMSFFETRFNKKLLKYYFSGSERFNSIVEQICFPHQPPLQKLVNNLETTWPHGAKIQQLHNQEMMPGLIRIFLENQIFPPHQDTLIRDFPELPQQDQPLSQLAINIYLSNFDEGGELELWDYAPDDEEVKRLYTGTHDFIDPDKIPANSIKLKPVAGELIIAQCSKLHAVSPGNGGKRIAFSCFSAYRGKDKPLTYWI